MIEVIKQWFHRYFSDPQAALLAVLLVAGFTIILTMGEILVPILASIVIAYLLEGVIQILRYFLIPRFMSVILVYVVFILALAFGAVFLLPLLSNQFTQFFQELPNMLVKGQQLLQSYSDFISHEQIANLINAMRSATQELGQNVIAYSLASIPTIITVLIYLVLVPLLVFFFLKDKVIILKWLGGLLPKERDLVKRVWNEMDAQMGNYIRGKVYEIFIVGILTYIPFAVLRMNYAPLLAALVGLSVIIPYIGAVVVTIPVLIVAYFQWGWSPEFMWAVSLFTIVQTLDGNILVPLLFSEAVNLHPVAIIVAVVVFGGWWGFWGVFFAIPLATLVKAVFTAWPRTPTANSIT
jgi:putative permease